MGFNMKTTTDKKKNVAVTKTSKPKTAAGLRDLPPKKDARGGLKMAESNKK